MRRRASKLTDEDTPYNADKVAALLDFIDQCLIPAGKTLIEANTLYDKTLEGPQTPDKEMPATSGSSYHDRQWAAKMREVGLTPTDTGEPGG